MLLPQHLLILPSFLREKHKISDGNGVGVVTTFTRDMVLADDSRPNVAEVVGIATTDAVDGVGDVILPEGLDWKSYFEKNGANLFVDHRYDVESRVGIARRWWKDRMPSGSMGWKLRAVIDREAPKARAVLAGANDGSIGLSIGFEAQNYGPPTAEERKKYPNASTIIRAGSVLEVSFTYMPCNVECRGGSVKVDEAQAERSATRAAALGEVVTKSLLLPKSVADATMLGDERGSTHRPRTILLID